jgi:hypothetical protein
MYMPFFYDTVPFIIPAIPIFVVVAAFAEEQQVPMS